MEQRQFWKIDRNCIAYRSLRPLSIDRLPRGSSVRKLFAAICDDEDVSSRSRRAGD
jgi:hypothetical protein